uniref:Uncharacterized protein n=1 Tax=Marseillevirus LCMAC102 TaxID=2506603 RepID=A0A481YTR4_9VIRU|nr:MAG: hypothetical protein LCMAC102_02150 [Marseillevirus LCMAC102]
MSLAPKTLAICYAWLSTIKNWTVAGAVSVLKDYDIVVAGAGLEDSSHGDHQNTDDIISHSDMTNTEVYGYITIRDGQSANETKIDNWDAMGVAGIFCDEFGFDYSGITRAKQNDLVDYIHTKSLKAFVNAWNPDDALSNNSVTPGNPQGTAHKLTTTDIYLAESFAVKDNAYDNTDTDTDGKPDWVEKAEKLECYIGDIVIACIGTTGTSTAGFTPAKADYSYYATAMYGFDVWGWGEKNYSSAGGPDSLPFRTRKTLPEGIKLHGSVVKTGDVYERTTNVGFHVDVDGHTVSDRLD